MTTDVEEEFEISEEVELTEKKDTAMQVAKALKKMGVKSNAKEADVIAAAKEIPNVKKHLEGKDPKKEIYVQGKLVSFVI